MPGQQGLHVANPDMDDWGHQASPTSMLFPGFDVCPSNPPPDYQSTTVLPTAPQLDKPLPPTPPRRRDVFKRRVKETGIVVGVGLAVPLAPGIIVVGGIAFIIVGGAVFVHSCFTMKGKKSTGGDEEADVHTTGWGTRSVPPPTPRLPHHNYGCNEKYKRRLENMLEHITLVSQGKAEPSDAILR